MFPFVKDDVLYSKKSMKKNAKDSSQTIYVCHDKPCAKKRRRVQKIMNLFPNAKKTKCMSVCKGPVVLFKKNKNKYYCMKIRKKKDRQRLWDFIVSGVRSEKLKFKV